MRRFSLSPVSIALWCAAFLLCLTACEQSRKRIVGKWQAADNANGMIWDFSPNGAVKVGDTAGRYTFGDRGRLKIETPSATFVYELDLKGDTMIWKDPKGARMELKRIP